MLKSIEQFGRRLILNFLRGSSAPLLNTTGSPSSILLIRIDPRVGNVIMLTAFLDELITTYPNAKLTLLGPAKAAQLLEQSPQLSTFWGFNKKELFGNNGWLHTLKRLRSNHFDLIIDASNPTSPSSTQTILTLLSKRAPRLGFGQPEQNAPYDIIAKPLEDTEAHENQQRRQLLAALGHPNKKSCLPNLRHLLKSSNKRIDTWLSENTSKKMVVLNIGARLENKQLQASQYTSLLQRLEALDVDLILTYGAQERALACSCVDKTTARLGPPTDLVELATLFSRASCVISCDTGPMHLSVAMGTPTCGIFVSTSPHRYGYEDRDHTRFDAREAFDSVIIDGIFDWVKERINAHESASPSTYSNSSPA